MVSVIVPVYGVEDYLDDCIQSICNQTYSDLEIILVDDGSQDACPMMCDEWAKKDSRIKVIHQKNGGLSNARNTGLFASKGEFILYVDSDDLIKQDMVESLINAIHEYDADVAISTFQIIGDDCSYERLSGKIIAGTPEEILPQIYDNYIYQAWGKLIKREYALRSPFVDRLIYEDYENTPRLITSVNKVVILMDGRYLYTVRSNSIMGNTMKATNADLARIVDSNLELYKKQSFSEKVKNQLYAFQIKQLVHNYHITIKNVPDDADDFLATTRYVLKKHYSKWAYSNVVSQKRKIAYLCLSYMPSIYRSFYMISHKEKEV